MHRGDGDGHRRRGSHQAAPDRPRDLHPLQHLRGDVPGRRDHARRSQLRRPRRRLQLLHGVHLAVPDRLDRQLADDAEGARLRDRGAAHVGRAAARAHARAARGRGRRAGGSGERGGRAGARRQARSRERRGAVQQRRVRRDRAAVVGGARVHQPVRAEEPDHRDASSATSTAPRRASTTRRTTSSSTSARSRSRCSKGQSIGIVPPGVDANGRPHVARQYSVASPRNGERPGYNNVSLTVKRVTEDHQGRPTRGVASNYLCDLKVGDAVQVIGPFGQSFLMPNHPKSHIVMICTGTGSAPMRAMTEWRRRLRKSGKFESGKLMLFFGARTREELPYFGPLQIAAEGLHRHQLRVLAHAGAAEEVRPGPDPRARRRPRAAARRTRTRTSTCAG